MDAERGWPAEERMDADQRARGEFDVLLARYWPIVQAKARVVARMSPGLADHHADDLAQEIMLRLIRDLTRGRTPDIPFRAVVSQVCRWEGARMARVARETPDSVELSDRLPDSADDGLVAMVARDEFDMRFAVLPIRVREAFTLKYLDGLDNDQIAARMAITTNNLHQLLHRGRQILARRWHG